MIDSAPMRPVGICLATLIAVASALALGACGGGDGDGQPSATEVAQTYADAHNQGDYAKVCSLYSDQLKQQLGGSNCEAFVKEQTSGGPSSRLEVTGVTENGDRATANFRSNAESGAPVKLTVSMEKRDGDWRITSIGPSGGAGAGTSPD
jgi:hypothetical protein